VDEISRYASAQSKTFAEICNLLKNEIDKILINAESRIYYSAPVWFIDDNPIVGYNATAKHVNLLFWSGQEFKEKELIAAGKFKAAQIKYTNITEINIDQLEKWLKKSKTKIWDYKNLRKNNSKKNKGII
jgi:hypothetical protein